MNENQSSDLVGATSEPVVNEEKKNVVSYESFHKSVQAEKNARKRAQDLQAQVEELTQKNLERDGKLSEANELLKKKLQELEGRLKKEMTYNLEGALNNSVLGKAREMGLKKNKVDHFWKMIDESDKELVDVEKVNGVYKVNEEHVNNLVGKYKDQFTEWFTVGSTKINDAPPIVKPEAKKEKPLSEMTREELEKLYKETYKN